MGAAGLFLSGVSAGVALSGTQSTNPGLVALARAAMVAVPVAVGLYAWHRRPSERFGPLLMAAGFGLFLTTLAESDDELLYSVGRVAGWIVEAGVVFLVLSYPSGRLRTRVDRWLVRAAVLLVATLYLPTALVTEQYALPGPYSSCTSDCPDNAFLLLSSEPAVVDAAIRPLRDLLTFVLFAAVTARLAYRLRESSGPMRRTLSPVLLVAGARTGLLAVAFVLWRVAPGDLLYAALWLIGLAVPAMALAFLEGLMRWRLFAGVALERLGWRLRAASDSEELTAALAEALDDRSLHLAFPVHDGTGWVDVHRRPVDLADPGEGLCSTVVSYADRQAVAIVHDVALRDQRDLLDSVVEYVRIALENQLLLARVEASVDELRASRGRVVASADEERRRIERNLHDGAQQRLVALGIELELAAELVRRDPEGGAERLHQLGSEVDETLEEIRALAHGVYPPLLAGSGLAEAMREVALRAPLDVRVDSSRIGRYPPAIESAVYFCCLEALQNAAKHASGARVATIRLEDDGSLRFEVKDDGGGFDVERVSRGAGLTSMADRIAAVGGDMRVMSAPGRGTVVVGSIPLDGDAGSPPKMQARPFAPNPRR